MGIFSLLYTNRKPRGFSYSPVFYDAGKERLEKRKKLIKQELLQASGIQTPESEFVSNIRGQFKVRKQVRSQFIHKQNFKILLIFILLLAITIIVSKHL